jgi:hypothetical protein
LTKLSTPPDTPGNISVINNGRKTMKIKGTIIIEIIADLFWRTSSQSFGQ